MIPSLRPEQFFGVFFWLLFAGIGLVIDLVICFFIYRVFNRVPAQFRIMEPGLVWLLIIPCFNLVWNFFVFMRLSRSLKRYFDSVGNQTVGDCGESLGLIYSICEVLRLIPCFGVLVWIAAIVLGIIYLVKVNQLAEQIPQAA